MRLINPYSGVDWTKQQKANLHAHTSTTTIGGTLYGSHDGTLSVSDLVNLYQGNGYDVFAITDHDWIGHDSQVTTYPLSVFGIDESSLDMLVIEGKELSNGHHRNSLFNDLGNF